MQGPTIAAWIFVTGFVLFAVSGIYLFANCTSYAGIFYDCQGTRDLPFVEIFGVTFYIGLAGWILGIVISMVLPPSESYSTEKSSD